MASPDFLVIGAQKAGTTWLDKMFRSHPQIWTPPVKELQFFNELYMPNTFKWTQRHRMSHGGKVLKWIFQKENIEWDEVDLAYHIARNKISYDWYEKIFDYAPEKLIKGEMTPEYSLLSEQHVKQIANIYTDLKIILIIRDPFERAVSGIKMRLLQEGFNDDSDQQEIDQFVINAAENWDVIQRGNYACIIEKWSHNYAADNFLIILSDDLRHKPGNSLNIISDFLNIDSLKFKANFSEKVHVGKGFNISANALDVVRKNQKDNLSWFNGSAVKYQIPDETP